MNEPPINESIPPQETAAFEPLMSRAESHWEEHCPSLVARLKKEGRLQEALTEAVSQCILAMQQCLDRGLSQDMAEEIALPMILLPPEK